MNKMCLLCARTSPDNNLFCQETYCPAEMSPYILDYGEWLSDIEIIRPVIVLRSSTLYEAQHNKQKVLLKVAHPGLEHTNRLKREAEFLQQLASAQQGEASLPRLLPPYANTTVAKDAYGKAMLKGHLLYFSLFEHFEGDSLRDVLVKNPQLWIYHVGWIMIGLASTVAFLQSQGQELLHYGLSPEAVLVRFDAEQDVSQVLLCDLGIASDHRNVKQNWYPGFVLPAYTAPELVDTAAPKASYASDVYGLGLILYELLVGAPAYSFQLSSDEEVYAAVRQNQHVRMNRFEDVKDVADIAVKAVGQAPAERQQSAADVARALLKIFGDTPAKKQHLWFSPRSALLVTAALLLIAFLITAGLYISHSVEDTSASQAVTQLLPRWETR